MLRRAWSRARSSLTSPTSAVYQLRAIWSATWPPYSTMLAPCSANVRATSSSSRGRSHDWSAIVTRKEVVAVDRDAAAQRDVAHDLVTRDRRAALRHADEHVRVGRPLDDDPERR